MWIRIEDNIRDHPKWEGASHALFGYHITLLTFCGRWNTDGRIPKSRVRGKLATGFSDDLVGRKIWHKASSLQSICPDCWRMVRGDPGDGWVVHDYLKMNFSKEEVERRFAESRSIRIAGGQARAAGARRDHGRFAPSADQQDASRSTPAGTSTVLPARNDTPGGNGTTPAERRRREIEASIPTGEVALVRRQKEMEVLLND